ncbi:MAG: amidohydrolase family protein [Bryobacteraceae bacterium]
MRTPALAIAASALAYAQVTAITGALVIDGRGAAPAKATVLIRGDRIVAVGPSVEIPSDATIVKAEGHTLLPGLFDLHTHLPYSAVDGWLGDWGKVLAAYLYCGVTSVVDYGTYPETFEPMRRLLRDGIIAGPRIHFAARITTPGGHGAEAGRGDFFSLEVLTPADARAAMKRLLPYRPDAIKVFTDGWRYGSGHDMTNMEEDALTEIVKLAKPEAMEVMTHTVTLERARIAARAGVGAMVHGISDQPVDAETAELFRKSGTAYVSTLAVYEIKRWAEPALFASILEPSALRLWRERSEPRLTGARERRWHNLTKNLTAMRDAGVAIASGTDAGVVGTIHGYSSLRELELMVEAGMEPLAAIRAATQTSAKTLHVEGERGAIAPGLLADLVLVEGRPHERIRDIEQVRRVWKGGVEVDREKLAKVIGNDSTTPIPALPATALIDDMEGERTRLDTLRVNATDSGHDHTKMIFTRTLRSPGNHALTIQATMSEKRRPVAQVVFPLSKGAVEPVDASRFEGIEFDARGDGQYGVVFQRRDVRRTGGYPRQQFSAGPEWVRVRVPLPATKADLQALAFEIARPPGTQGWLELDNLRFY